MDKIRDNHVEILIFISGIDDVGVVVLVVVVVVVVVVIYINIQ